MYVPNLGPLIYHQINFDSFIQFCANEYSASRSEIVSRRDMAGDAERRNQLLHFTDSSIAFAAFAYNKSELGEKLPSSLIKMM